MRGRGRGEGQGGGELTPRDQTSEALSSCGIPFALCGSRYYSRQLSLSRQSGSR